MLREEGGLAMGFAKIIWLLLLMPVNSEEQITIFPGTFETREQCMSLGAVLITQREFRCQASPQRTAFASLKLK